MTCFYAARIGPQIHLQAMCDFNDVIQRLCLVEPPLGGRSFTWTNGWDYPSSVKDSSLIDFSIPWNKMILFLHLVRALPRTVESYTAAT